MTRLLILGGTTEANELAAAVAKDGAIDAVLSLAGRTTAPVLPAIRTRIGGFGGTDGLIGFLRSEHIDAVVDATHPFAARMSANAIEACRESGVPLAAFTRRPWLPVAGDRWVAVADIAAAVCALGETPRRVFLTTGRLNVASFKAAPQHSYLIRTVDQPDPATLPNLHRSILGRGPFLAADEEALMRAEGVQVLVTKNSGGRATEGKLVAARRLGVPVIMVERPMLPVRLEFAGLPEVLAWLRRQQDEAGRDRRPRQQPTTN